MRAISFCVKFDEFTNNAHILDFGNGAGNDNVWIGIVGRGNADFNSKEKILLCGNQDTLPVPPSGQQPTLEVSPQKLMETTCANVND